MTAAIGPDDPATGAELAMLLMQVDALTAKQQKSVRDAATAWGAPSLDELTWEQFILVKTWVGHVIAAEIEGAIG